MSDEKCKEYQGATTDSYNDYVPGENILKLKQIYRDGTYNPAGEEIEVSYNYSYQVGIKDEEIKVVGKLVETWEPLS